MLLTMSISSTSERWTSRWNYLNMIAKVYAVQNWIQSAEIFQNDLSYFPRNNSTLCLNAQSDYSPCLLTKTNEVSLGIIKCLWSSILITFIISTLWVSVCVCFDTKWECIWFVMSVWCSLSAFGKWPKSKSFRVDVQRSLSLCI